VTGGHPLVRAIRTTIGDRAPRLTDWEPSLAVALGLVPSANEET